MDFKRLFLCAGLAGAILLSVGVSQIFSQTLQQRGYRPVEQLHEDVDPLARSLQRQEPGLSTTGEHHNVFKPLRGDRRLYYIGQGVVAQFDRSDYYFSEKRGILQVIPPNTVFHIGLPPQELPSAGESAPPSEQMVQGRVDGRVGTSAPTLNPQGRRFLMSPNRNPQQQPQDPPLEFSSWQRFRAVSFTQRRIVTNALQRLSASPTP